MLSLLLAAATLAFPAAGLAKQRAPAPSASVGNGGAELAASGGAGLAATGGSAQAATPLAQPANLSVSASGDGITVTTSESVLVSQTVQFSGTAPAADAGELVAIERIGPQTGASWVATAQSLVAPDGSFAATWLASQSGPFAVRAALVPTSGSAQVSTTGAGAALASTPTLPAGGPASSPLAMSVYRPALASYFGPGFFGKKTACGQTLRRSTLGVANLRLKCGTPVRILYGGMTIVVPVIDRGPYVHGVSWDLTQATANALGIASNSTIGTIALDQGP
jgi:hypothetical protein